MFKQFLNKHTWWTSSNEYFSKIATINQKQINKNKNILLPWCLQNSHSYFNETKSKWHRTVEMTNYPVFYFSVITHNSLFIILKINILPFDDTKEQILSFILEWFWNRLLKWFCQKTLIIWTCSKVVQRIYSYENRIKNSIDFKYKLYCLPSYSFYGIFEECTEKYIDTLVVNRDFDTRDV